MENLVSQENVPKLFYEHYLFIYLLLRDLEHAQYEETVQDTDVPTGQNAHGAARSHCKM